MASVKAFWVQRDEDFEGFEFPDGSSLHFWTYGGFRRGNAMYFNKSWVSSIPATWHDSYRIGDFGFGPGCTFVISERVRSGLPQSVCQDSHFVACEFDRPRRDKAFVWVMLKTMPAISWERDKDARPSASSTKWWNYDVISEIDSPVVRDTKYESRWIAITNELAGFNLKNAYEENGWSGLVFSEDLEHRQRAPL